MIHEHTHSFSYTLNRTSRILSSSSAWSRAAGVTVSAAASRRRLRGVAAGLSASLPRAAHPVVSDRFDPGFQTRFDLGFQTGAWQHGSRAHGLVAVEAAGTLYSSGLCFKFLMHERQEV